MNCLLHGMEGDDQGVVHLGNTLDRPGSRLPRTDIILTNPPFGTAKGGGGSTRDDFTYKTSNKQLAFLQHIARGLKPGGRAAVVLPDNVLFEAGVCTDNVWVYDLQRTMFQNRRLQTESHAFAPDRAMIYIAARVGYWV